MSLRKINAITLAAGYGTRLRPITDHLPKPLVSVGGRALLDVVFANLAAAGVAEIAVNTHHLAERLEDALTESGWRRRTTVFREKEILGTGGPIVAARELLSNADAFILHNGDILTDADLADLADAHFAADAAVTMLLIEGPENKVAVSSDGRVIDILGRLGRSGGDRLLTYAGIAVFSPEIFDHLPSEPVNCSIISAVLDLMRERPGAVSAFVPEGIRWNDLGTVERMVVAWRSVETGELKLPPISAENAPPVRSPMTPLPLQGSDRLFIRLENAARDGGSAVAMCAPGDDDNFARFAVVGKFLHDAGLGAPEIFEISSENGTLVMEDLGDDTLLALSARLAPADLERRYEAALEWLVDFQAATFDGISEEDSPRAEIDGNLPLRLFDLDYLLWESSYFADNYLVRLRGVSESDLEAPLREFRALAELALSHPQVMIHRDFQSSNILFKNGEVRIVDFQGARVGHIAYDSAALLKDPYVQLSKTTRKRLFKRHFEFFRNSPLPEALESRPESNSSHPTHGGGFSAAELRDEKLFAKFAATASLQRNMQALGAFVFLSKVKGKSAYERFIEPGAALLLESLREFNSLYPGSPMAATESLLASLPKHPRLRSGTQPDHGSL